LDKNTSKAFQKTSEKTFKNYCFKCSIDTTYFSVNDLSLTVFVRPS